MRRCGGSRTRCAVSSVVLPAPWWRCMTNARIGRTSEENVAVIKEQLAAYSAAALRAHMIADGNIGDDSPITYVHAARLSDEELRDIYACFLDACMEGDDFADVALIAQVLSDVAEQHAAIERDGLRGMARMEGR